MKRKLRETSLTTYRQIIEEEWYGGDKLAVLEAYILHGPATDREIAGHLGWDDVYRCRRRRSELTDAGVIVPIDTTICPVTDRPVTIWTVVEGEFTWRSPQRQKSCPTCGGTGKVSIETIARARNDPNEPILQQWLWPSESDPAKKYVITMLWTGEIACQCLDFTYRRHACKHIRGLLRVRQGDLVQSALVVA